MPDVHRLRQGRSQYAILREDAGHRKLLVLLTRQISIERAANPAALVLTQRWDAEQGSQSDTSRSLLATLEPLTFRGHQQGTTYDLTFSRTAINGTQASADSGARPFLVQLDEPVYNEIIDDLIVRAQPLAPKLAFRFRALDPGESARDITARVTGSERLGLPDGSSVDTWVVTQTGVRDFVVTWWIAKSTREEVQTRISEPGGAAVWRVRLSTQASLR
jgi:hypothetical protein